MVADNQCKPSIEITSTKHRHPEILRSTSGFYEESIFLTALGRQCVRSLEYRWQHQRQSLTLFGIIVSSGISGGWWLFHLPARKIMTQIGSSNCTMLACSIWGFNVKTPCLHASYHLQICAGIRLTFINTFECIVYEFLAENTTFNYHSCPDTMNMSFLKKKAFTVSALPIKHTTLKPEYYKVLVISPCANS